MMSLRLLQIEWIKLFYSRSFLILLGIYSVIFVLTIVVLNNTYEEVTARTGNGDISMVMGMASTLFFAPEVWKLIIYIASFLNFLLILVFILMLSNEYKYRTLRQHVIDGLNYTDLIIGKQIFIGFLVIFAMIHVVILSSAIAKNNVFLDFGKSVSLLFHYMLSLFFILNFSYLMMTLTKRTVLTIMVLLLYRLLELYLYYKLPDDIAHWLPFQVVNRLIPIPAENMIRSLNVPMSASASLADIIVCLLYTLVCIGLIYLKLSKNSLTR